MGWLSIMLSFLGERIGHALLCLYQFLKHFGDDREGVQEIYDVELDSRRRKVIKSHPSNGSRSQSINRR